MYGIEHCYKNGNLASALLIASDFVSMIGDGAVHHVIAYMDSNIEGAWWVDVVYEKPTE